MQTTYENLKYRVIFLLIVIGNSVIFLFGIVNIILRLYVSAAVELSASAGGYLSLYLAQKKQKTEISGLILFSSFALMCWYLFFTGGIQNTGILWMFAIPMVSFFLLGNKKGLYSIFVFIIVIFSGSILHFLNQFRLPYPNTYLIIFLISLSVFSILMFLFDRLRDNAESSLKNKILEIEALNKRLEYYSFYDSLTGVFNRRQIISILEKEIERFKRSKNSFCIILIDLDHFKNINDSYGHLFGDNVLKGIVSSIHRDILRKSDSIGRYGGEEFLVIMPDTSIHGAYIASERIREYAAGLDFSICGHNNTINVTLSLGITEISENDSIDEILHKSDIALYEAKRKGRNRSEMFASTLIN